MTYKDRLKKAECDAQSCGKEGVELAVELYGMGHSLRIISEITGFSRSKLQRYLSENGVRNLNSVNTKRLNNNLSVAGRMIKEGCSLEDVCVELGVSEWTVRQYLKQLGFGDPTRFRWD